MALEGFIRGMCLQKNTRNFPKSSQSSDTVSVCVIVSMNMHAQLSKFTLITAANVLYGEGKKKEVCQS